MNEADRGPRQQTRRHAMTRFEIQVNGAKQRAEADADSPLLYVL